MKASRSSAYSARVLLIAVLVSAIVLLGIAITTWISTPEDPQPTAQTYTVTLENYLYFNFDDVEYGFILARIKITSNKPLTVDLQRMTTNEQLTLNAIDTYKSPLVDDGYVLNCPGTDENSEISASLCLFIPILNTNASEAVLKVQLDRAYNISFNLLDAEHFGTKAMVGIDEITASFTAEVLKVRVVSTRSFTVEDAEGGTVEAPFSSQSQVFGVEIRLASLVSSTTIEAATLTIDGSGTYQLVNPEYTNDEELNLLGLAASPQQTAYLFFEITDPDLDLNMLDLSMMTLNLRAAGETNYVAVSAAP